MKISWSVYLILVVFLLVLAILLIRLYASRKFSKKMDITDSEINGKIENIKYRLKIVKNRIPRGYKVELSDKED